MINWNQYNTFVEATTLLAVVSIITCWDGVVKRYRVRWCKLDTWLTSIDWLMFHVESATFSHITVSTIFEKWSVLKFTLAPHEITLFRNPRKRSGLVILDTGHHLTSNPTDIDLRRWNILGKVFSPNVTKWVFQICSKNSALMSQ